MKLTKTIFENNQSLILNLGYLNIGYLDMEYLNMIYLNIGYLDIDYLNMGYFNMRYLNMGYFNIMDLGYVNYYFFLIISYLDTSHEKSSSAFSKPARLSVFYRK